MAAVAVAAMAQAVPQAANAVTTGDNFTGLAPTRLLDSRSGLGMPGGTAAKIGAAGTVTLQVTGVGGVPSGADAVVLNVTAIRPTMSTYISVYPADLASPPVVSNINVGAQGTVPNLVTVKLDATGAVKLYNAKGSVDLIADVAGYYASAATDTFTSLTPTRTLDTRSGLGAPTGKVGPAASIDLQVTGVAGVPVGADAVVLNLTGTGPTSGTFVAAYPTPASPGAPPTVSNLNLKAGETAANLAIVAIGTGGKIRLYNAVGSVHLVADVAGYFSTDASGSVYTPISPTRVIDTRVAPGKVGPGGLIDLHLAGTNGMPSDATAVVFNYTGVAPSNTTYLQAYPTPPTGYAVPTVSNLNLTPKAVRANLAAVQLGAGGDVRLRNQVGLIDVLADLAGYYTSTAGVDHGTPPPPPPLQGVTVVAGVNNPSPLQGSTVDVNVTTLAGVLVQATAAFSSGSVTKSVTADVNGAATLQFAVGSAPAGVPVVVTVTATSAQLGSSATTTTSFTPVALAPLTCKASASPTNPLRNTDVDIIVLTKAGALATAVFNFRGSHPSQSATANGAGRADIVRNVGSTSISKKVNVSVTVKLGTQTGTCSTSFKPR
jgi:hypothetical protein